MSWPDQQNPQTRLPDMSDRALLPARVVFGLALFFCALALGYLIFKTNQLSGRAGFDFRYIWLAGDIWLDGISPYAENYQDLGEARVTEGHVPILWVYPPSWWAIATTFGTLGLYASNLAWNITGDVLGIFTCGLVTNAFFRTFQLEDRGIYRQIAGETPFAYFSALLFLFATLEATAILISVGQTTLYACFGLAVMLRARIAESNVFEAIGLTLVMLKPQIGLPIAVLLLFLDARSRRVVILAAVMTLFISLPAIIISPATPIDFLRNLSAYDSFTDANLPNSMTGIRHVIFALGGIDIGNFVATGLTLLAILVTCTGPLSLCRAPKPEERAWQVFALATCFIIALAPLHIYDLVLIVIPLAVLMLARGFEIPLGALGMLLIWRSENLADFTGFHAPEVIIFPGSRVATIGAILFLFAAIRVVVSLNKTAETAPSAR